MYLKQMTDNIDESLLIVIDEAICFSFDSYARGYHAYKNIWNPVDGEILVCTRETDNSNDTYTLFPSCVIICCRACTLEFEQGFFKLPFTAWIYHIMYCYWKESKSWGWFRT